MSSKAKKDWIYLGAGTTVDISEIYQDAFEYLVAFKDSNELVTMFQFRYNLLSNNFASGYYYDNLYHACKAIVTSKNNIGIHTTWTRVYKNGVENNDGNQIFVYYR